MLILSNTKIQKYRMKRKGFILGLCILLSLTLFITACGSTQTGTSSTSKSSTPTTPYAYQVKVVLTNTTLNSSRTMFAPNVTYDFAVTNNGTSPHDFIIRTKVQGPTANHQTEQGILYIIPANHLFPGKTVHFSYAFPLATQQSNVQFTEHLAGVGTAAGPMIPVQVRAS